MLEEARAALDRGEGVTANAWKAVKVCLLDDLNTPAAIGTLSEPLKAMNELLIVRKKKPVRCSCPVINAVSLSDGTILSSRWNELLRSADH